MKYHIPKGLVIALIALLCMGTVAVAGGVLGRTVDWDGNIIGEDESYLPSPTATPCGMTDSQMTMDLLAIEMIKTAGDMELVAVYTPNQRGEFSSTYNGITRTVATMAELEALLADAPELPLPSYIPEGFAFASASVAYGCQEDGEYTYLGREELDYGMYAERYRLEDECALVMGYSLTLRDTQEDYHYIQIDAGMRPVYQENSYEFGVNADETAVAVTVPGWEKALSITGPRHCHLAMRRPLQQVIRNKDFNPNGVQMEELDDVQMSVSAPFLDTDTLIRMFAAE